MNSRVAVSVFFFINGLVFASWAARLPDLQERFALSHQQIGWLLLIHSIGSIVAMPLTGWLIGRCSSKAVTTVSGLMFPVCFIAIAFVHIYPLLFLPFLLMGAAAGILDVAMNAQAVAVEESLSKPVMTMFHAVFSVGMVAGGILGGFFVSGGYHLAHHFGVVAVLSIMMVYAAASHLFVNEDSEIDDGILFIIPRGSALLLGLIAFCCMMGEGAISDWSTNYMKRIVGTAEHLQTYGITAFAAAMTLGRFIGDRGRLAIGDKTMLMAGASLAIVGGGAAVLIVHTWSAILGFGLVGLGLSNIVPIVYSLSGKLQGFSPGVGIAMATTIGYSGFMVGPPLIGFVSDVSSLRYGLTILVGIFVVMFFIILFSVNKVVPNEAP